MKIPFHKTPISEEDITAVTETLRSGWLTMGPKTIEFEKQFAAYVGAPQAIAMNSATACLHLALKAVGVKAGDEVILPTNTFVSTAEVVTYFDAIPVLCDIEPVSHNIDVTQLPDLITPKTRAIIPVHFAGNPCDMDPITDLAKRHQIAVIEDAAHAPPIQYKGKTIGTLSDITCFSLYATKTLPAGEGGLATTANPDYAKHMATNRLHGMNRDAWNRYSEKGRWHYDIIDNGHKYNMTDLHASIGLSQLKKVDQSHQKRVAIANRYTAAFDQAGIDHIAPPDFGTTSWHLYIIRVSDRNRVIEALNADGIGTSVHFIPIHKHQYYQKTYGYQDLDYPVANRVFDQSISLPIFPGMTDDQVDYVIDRVIHQVKTVRTSVPA